MVEKQKNILWFEEIRKKDTPLVGGKNASLGEMYTKLTEQGVNIPDGFALTSAAYWYFLKENKIADDLKEIFDKFNPDSLKSLQKTGKQARNLILKAKFPDDLKEEVLEAYQKLSEKYKEKKVDVAVRSSATAEDLPSASFAGQHETFLNIRGGKELLKSAKKCMASMFNDRAISYREEKGFDHLDIALSVGVQKMVRSDLASSGVMFTIDTETGFSDVVLINSIFGVGEMIVKGQITPDGFYVFKPTLEKGHDSIITKNLGRKDKKYIYGKKGGLKEVGVKKDKQLDFSITDEEVLTLAKWAVKIENLYNRPQDIEWAKDGKTGELFVVQSRPETVHASEKKGAYREYEVNPDKKPILEGTAIGDKIGHGRTRVIPDISEIGQFKEGEVLVTDMTDPDWVPIMKKAAAIVTNEGGKTAHAAIVSRELGVPCIVGTEKATKILKTGQEVTVDCTQGLNGRVFSGEVPYKVKEYNLGKIPDLKTKIMVNIAAPEIAFKTSFLPNDGVGLAREEFIITEKIRVHPLALYHYKKLKSKRLSLKSKAERFNFEKKVSKTELNKIIKKIEKVTVEHENKKEFFVKELAEGIAQIGAGFYPKPVIVRFSDFKTNEYAQLIGGQLFEPSDEANPMLGWRGASRYYDPKFKPAFKMECEAIKRVRNTFGLKNIKLMIPFCRTVEEGKKVLEIMKKAGLERGKDGLEVYVMCEIPSNVIIIDEFLKLFDGVSVGSNDLLQTSLGMDRDNATVQEITDERNPTIKKMVSKVIRFCNMKGKYCGICGEAPSTYEEFAKFLVEEEIESISLNPDTVIKTIMSLAGKKKNLKSKVKESDNSVDNPANKG